MFFNRLYDENRDINVTLGLRDHFNRPHVIQKVGLLDGLIRGLATQSSQKMDTDYARVVSIFLNVFLFRRFNVFFNKCLPKF